MPRKQIPLKILNEAYKLKQQTNQTWNEIAITTNNKFETQFKGGNILSAAIKRHAKRHNLAWPIKDPAINKSRWMYEDRLEGAPWEEISQCFNIPIFKCRDYVRRYCKFHNLHFPE